MPSDLVRFSIAIPESLLNRFDEYTSRRGLLVNRSEAIRDLIREALVDEQLENASAYVVGTITMIYDHHVPDLSHKIGSVQHNYPDVVVSTMHVHLTHRDCLEVVAVKGTSREVHELADCLSGIKGVEYAKLSVAVAMEDNPTGDSHGHTHAHDHAHPHTHSHGTTRKLKHKNPLLDELDDDLDQGHAHYQDEEA